MRFRLSDLTPGLIQPLWAATALVCAVAPCQLAWAQDAVQLKSSPLLQDKLPPDAAKSAPVFLQADRITGRPDLDTTLEGGAVLRKAGTVIRADRLTYDQSTDRAVATGNVRINRGGNIYEGPLLDLKVDAFEGFFTAPSYQFLQNDAHGTADRADFQDASHATVHNATYTTCRREAGPDWLPGWILRAKRIDLDNDEETGVAHGAVLSFQGVPILPVPAISFPLSDKRKSGVLPPTLGLDNVNGAELVLPYYWNIAPNRDATLTPTVMTARGVDLGAEFRYLEPSYGGGIRANYMPSDQLRKTDRWGVSLIHAGNVDTGMGGVGVSVNLNRVSDDDYWRDFTRSSPALTQRLLPNDLVASWGQGALSTSLRVLQWQTLQDVTAPIVPPYDRAPQLTARYALDNWHGLDASVEGDFTQFVSNRTLTLQPNAQRSLGVVQISRPWLAPAGFLIPKLQLHASSYQFDDALSNGRREADSVVPTFSLDSGLVFEREASLWGKSLVQTLEPRAYYVYTPYRDQRLLPNYDTAGNDFNFASIYTDNAFVGHDKIADNNLLTLGVTTRLLDADTGAQYARFGFAQRLRFEDQKVTLTPATSPALAGFSDILLGASVNIDSRWVLDSTVQYNAKTEQSVRSTIGASYRPGEHRVFNAAYRFQSGLSEQVDTSWQWPLSFSGTPNGPLASSERVGRYYAVGRMNYSLNERRLVDSVLGVEYDAGCWLGRVVFQRVQTSTSSATENLAFQLDFVGFTRLGVGRNPQSTFAQNISRYQNLREPGTAPSRFSNYD
ncbi:MAG: LPS biosynthesis protein [Burkholderiales bacterium PBB3]|nr:MAG: LPS biosynthesis protein [Burkholderiales bacterium PBB3]